VLNYSSESDEHTEAAAHNRERLQESESDRSQELPPVRTLELNDSAMRPSSNADGANILRRRLQNKSPPPIESLLICQPQPSHSNCI